MIILEGEKMALLDGKKACEKVIILEGEKQSYQKVRTALLEGENGLHSQTD